jgi:hypothetical protein
MLKNKRSWLLLGLAFIGAISIHIFCFGALPLILVSPEIFAPLNLDLPITHPINPRQALHMKLVNQISNAEFGYLTFAAFGENNALIASQNSDLRILDVTSPANPSVSSFYTLPMDSIILDASLQGQFAYLGTDDGIVVFDISDPKGGTPVGTYKAPNRIKRISISGNYAYLVDEHNGFYILDIADPTRLRLITYYERLDGINYISDLVINKNYAYFTEGAKVQIIDVSNPMKLAEIGSYDANYGFEDSPSKKISIINDLAFLNEGYKNGIDPFVKSYLTILDISNPAKPLYVVSYSWCENCFVGGVTSDFVYLQMDNEIHLVNFSNPKNPVELGYYGLPARYDWYTGFGRDNHIYLVDDESSFYNLQYLP